MKNTENAAIPASPTAYFTFFPFRSSGNARNRSRNSEIIRLSANRSFIFTLPLYFSTLSYRLYTPTFFTLRIAVKYLLKFIFKSDIV